MNSAQEFRDSAKEQEMWNAINRCWTKWQRGNLIPNLSYKTGGMDMWNEQQVKIDRLEMENEELKKKLEESK